MLKTSIGNSAFIGELQSVLRRTIKLAISLTFFSGVWISRRLQFLLGREIPGTCVVLYYHSVPREFRHRFADQMDILTRYAKPVRSDLKYELKKGVHHAAVTFHDAFLSVCENALPEMAGRRIPATLFVPTGYLARHPGWAMEYGNADRNEVVINIDQMKSLNSELVAIGSHTITHPDLATLNEQEALQELEQSKLTLESILNRSVDLFAFPYGSYNNNLTLLCKKVGYCRVFTIQPNLAFSEPNEYVTGSCAVTAADWRLEFKLKLLGGYCWHPHFSRVRQRMDLVWRNRFSNKWSVLDKV